MSEQKQYQRGFSLLELAIAITLVGLLLAAGLPLFSTTMENWGRAETRDYMEESVQSLLVYSGINGSLPYADDVFSADGSADAGTLEGLLPYLDLQVLPKDGWRRQLKYEVHPDLVTDRGTSCAALEASISGAIPPGLIGGPSVWDSQAGLAYPVAAILVSGGARDADEDGSVFDAVYNAETSAGGDNVTGSPAYLRRIPDDQFDDLVVTVSAPRLYRIMECGKPKSP